MLLLLLAAPRGDVCKERHSITYASAVPVGFPPPAEDDEDGEPLPSGGFDDDRTDMKPPDEQEPEDSEDPKSNLVYIPRILVSGLLAMAVLSVPAIWFYHRSNHRQNSTSSTCDSTTV